MLLSVRKHSFIRRSYLIKYLLITVASQYFQVQINNEQYKQVSQVLLKVLYFTGYSVYISLVAGFTITTELSV